MTSTALGYAAIKKQTDDTTVVQPTNFIRILDGDLTKTINLLKHKPIQNSRRGTKYVKEGKHDLEGEYETDLDFNESVRRLYGLLGSISSSDISSGTDGSVYRHTITLAAQDVPAFTIERVKGNTADTSNDKQNYITKRGFGVKVDQLTIQGSDGDAIKCNVVLQMLGIFDQAILKADAAAGSSVDMTLDTVEGLTTSDTVQIFDGTTLEEDAVAAITPATPSIQIATLGNSFNKDDTKVELAPQTPSYSTAPQNASLFDAKFQFAATIGAAASAAETNVDSFTFNVQNQVEVVAGTIRKGNGRVNAKRPMATIEISKVFESKAEYEKWLRTEKQALIITLSNETIVSGTDTNNATYKVQIKCPNVVYESFEIPTGNDSIYEIQATLEVVDDDTAGYAVQIVAENEKVGTYYTA